MARANKPVLGIDIGSCTLKLALCSGQKIRRLAEIHMPDSLVKDGRVISPEAMAEFLKTAVRKSRTKTRRCAVIIPSSQVFVRQTVLPVMTEEQLKINLPYEFRDYISDDRDKYYYDYYVIACENDENGQPEKLELMAAAARKDLIAQYNDICRWAGLKLVTAIPAEMAIVNLLRRAEAEDAELADREQCFLDLGHTGTRIFFYDGDRYNTVRSDERGGLAVNEALAAKLNVDVHIAEARKEANTDDALGSPEVTEIFGEIATDVMRAVNFYAYNNHDSELQCGWLCGGGSRVDQLCAQIRGQLGFELRPVSELILDSPDPLLSDTCFAAIGAALN